MMSSHARATVDSGPWLWHLWCPFLLATLGSKANPRLVVPTCLRSSSLPCPSAHSKVVDTMTLSPNKQLWTFLGSPCHVLPFPPRARAFFNLPSSSIICRKVFRTNGVALSHSATLGALRSARVPAVSGACASVKLNMW